MNYIKVHQGLKLNKGKKGIPALECYYDGYVVNSSDHLNYENSLNHMTPERAKSFLLSLRGIFENEGITLKTACDICLGCHYVYRKEGSEEWICTCANFWHRIECSHTVLADHLENVPGKSIPELRGAAPWALLPYKQSTKARAGFPELPKNFGDENDNEYNACKFNGLPVCRVLESGERCIGKISHPFTGEDHEILYTVTYERSPNESITENLTAALVRVRHEQYQWELNKGNVESRAGLLSVRSA